MKERPIIFSSEMVRAILDGRKTQTRRPIKPQPTSSASFKVLEDGRIWMHNGEMLGHGDHAGVIECPYGEPGDRLWVRETFCIDECVCQQVESHLGEICNICHKDVKNLVIYKADKLEPRLWSPSTHMPHWASRITLEIVNVRVERVQSISVEDAISDGVKVPQQFLGVDFDNNPIENDEAYEYHPVDEFARLWDSIYGKTEFAWDKNPWVWVIEFNRV